MERSTGIDDYHLKGCMAEQKCKINVSGSYPHFPKSPLVKIAWQGG